MMSSNYNTQQIVGIAQTIQNEPCLQQNNGQPIIIQVQTSSVNYNLYPKQAAIGLGCAQIVIGLLCIVFGILVVTTEVFHSIIGPVGHGIWCGVMFVVAGSLTVAAGGTKTPCLVISSMVLSIIAAVFVTGIVTSSILSIVISSYEDREYYRGGIIAEGILLALAFLELVIAILSAVLTCKTLGCCRKEEVGRNEQPQIMYLPNTSQATGGLPSYNDAVVVGQNQQATNPQYSDVKVPLV